MSRAALGLALVLASGCTGGSQDVPPPVPDGLQARALGVRGAEIGWRDRSGGEAWSAVERSGPDAGFERVGLLEPGESVWVDWGLQSNTAYRYRVIAMGPGGESPPSAAAGIRTQETLIPEPRVTVLDASSVSPGITLFNVEDPDDVYTVSVVMAVDGEGRVIWHFEHEGQFVSETDLFPNGDILAQVGPSIARRNRKGDLVDYYDEFYVHHDVDVLPWGNLIAISSRSLQEKKEPEDWYSRDWVIEIDMKERILPRIIHFDFLLPEYEICRACITGEVAGGLDWIHINAVDYDLAEEAVYVSVRNLNRIYKISYPEGEIEWTMGDGGDFGAGLFDHQHNPVRTGPGRMLVFDNGLHSDPFEPDRSRVIEIEYDPEALSARIVWEYAGPPPFYSEAQGDATRLANGNTLVVDSFNSRIIEVTHEGLPVWELTLPPPYYIYKAHRIENFP